MRRNLQEMLQLRKILQEFARIPNPRGNTPMFEQNATSVLTQRESNQYEQKYQ